MKPFLLASACRGGHADFAARHWLPSLRAHVDLDQIDVVMFDYGIDRVARDRLVDGGVEIIEGTGSSEICSARFEALAGLLGQRPYEQASLVDCGDLIYQRDVSDLFTRHEDQFRAVCEDVCCDFLGFMMGGEDFEPDVWKGLLRELRDQPMINGSGLVAPRELWLAFAEDFRGTTRSQDHFGTDQAFINLHLHRVGFRRLPSTYNFSLKTVRQPFSIRESVFYDATGERIAVVHNTGGSPSSRAIRNFGYGPGHNRGVRHLGRWATRVAYSIRRGLRL